MAGGTGMPMGALAGAALGGRGVAPAPTPTMAGAAQPAAVQSIPPQTGVMKAGQPQPGFNVNQAAAVQSIPPQTGAMKAGQPRPGFNVNQAAASGLQQAMQGTQQAMQGPLNVGAYANPYTSAVIERTQQDIARQQEIAQNQLGAQATAARAFGGSRQGVAEGVMAGEYGRMAGDMAAQQRQQNYSQALQAAMADRQARLGAASQMGQLGQQAFGTGQAIQQQQAQQGLLQQGIQQALIDAARQQYAGYTGAPSQALQAPLAALGIAQGGGAKTVTESQSPGLLSYLQTIGQMCWVAREVYGEDNPKWLQFREWVIGYSPNWFYNAYSKYGESVAKVVAKVPALKLVIRPFMDAKRKAMGYK